MGPELRYLEWKGLDLTAHDNCVAIVKKAEEGLNDSQVSGSHGSRADSGTSHQDGKSGEDQI